jgi:hypothetical protein
MTPLVTVTPRLEQELRWDFYDQQNGAGTQGNSQRLLSDGGPGGPRVEFIPTYDTPVWLSRKQAQKLVELGYISLDSKGDKRAEAIAIEAYLAMRTVRRAKQDSPAIKRRHDDIYGLADKALPMAGGPRPVRQHRTR